MNLNELCKWCEGIVPEADENIIPSISTTQLCKRDILNEGASEFVRFTKCLPREKKINCEANTPSYSISSKVPDFMEMREEGIWHYNNTTWDRLKPITIRELDQEFSTWRNQSSNDQVRNYYQDGDTIGLFYTPSSAVSNGLWIYYYGLSSDMTTLSHYPFTGTTTRDPRLSVYEKLLLVYYEYRALGILGYKQDSVNKELEFYKLCDEAKKTLQGRRDLAQESRAKPKTLFNRNMFR